MNANCSGWTVSLTAPTRWWGVPLPSPVILTRIKSNYQVWCWVNKSISLHETACYHSHTQKLHVKRKHRCAAVPGLVQWHPPFQGPWSLLIFLPAHPLQLRALGSNSFWFEINFLGGLLPEQAARFATYKQKIVSVPSSGLCLFRSSSFRLPFRSYASLTWGAGNRPQW